MKEFTDPFAAEQPVTSGGEEGLPSTAGGQHELPPEVTPAQKGWTREMAVAQGRRYGEDEANRRGEIGEERDERVARAMAYAVWEYDGKPASSEKQRLEFSVPQATVTPSLERFQRANDFKRQKKK